MPVAIVAIVAMVLAFFYSTEGSGVGARLPAEERVTIVAKTPRPVPVLLGLSLPDRNPLR